MAQIRNLEHNGAQRRAEVSRSNIPPIEVKKIVDVIESATGSQVVIIGGRAVNIWTKQHWRPSHDIDVVIDHKPTAAEFNAMNEYASLFGARFEINGDPSFASRMKLKYYSDETDKEMPEGFVKIDLYYPGYVSSVNDRKPKNDIGGVPIWDIIDKSVVKSFVDERERKIEFRVAEIPQMLMMKLAATKSDEGKRGDKDRLDIQAIVQIALKDRYELSKNADALIRSLERYFPESAGRRFEEIFDKVDYKKLPKIKEQIERIKRIRRGSSEGDVGALKDLVR